MPRTQGCDTPWVLGTGSNWPGSRQAGLQAVQPRSLRQPTAIVH